MANYWDNMTNPIYSANNYNWGYSNTFPNNYDWSTPLPSLCPDSSVFSANPGPNWWETNQNTGWNPTPSYTTNTNSYNPTIAPETIEKVKKDVNTFVPEKPIATDEMTMEEYKSDKGPGKSFWKRAGRAISNMGQGILNLGAKFIGYEDGKWNWKKCLKNVAIAGAAVAACAIPVVGPIISAGLIATGVISGGVAVTKGAIKASKAKTVKEFDAAWQEIGSGAAIGVTSALGLRGLGKGARVSGVTGTKVVGSKTSPVSTGTATTGTAATGTAAAGFWGKTGQFFVDCSKNAYAGTRDAMTKSRGSNYWKNIKESVKPNFDKKYEQKIDKLNGNKGIDRYTRLWQETGEKISMDNSVKTASFFKNVKDPNLNKADIKKLLEEIPMIKNIIKEIPNKNLKKEYLAYLKEAKQLIKAKEKSIHRKAIVPTKENRKALKDYYGDNSYLMWGKDIFLSWGLPKRLLWYPMSKPFTYADKAMRNPMTAIFKIEETVLPTSETNMVLEMASMFGADAGPVYTRTKLDQMEKMNNLA